MIEYRGIDSLARLAAFDSWSPIGPRVDQIALTWADARRMAGEALEIVMSLRGNELCLQVAISRRQLLRSIAHSEYNGHPLPRIRLTVAGRLAGIMWISSPIIGVDGGAARV